MSYDFDKAIDRRGTNCLKYDFAPERGKSPDLLPMWIADMDFETAPEIVEEIKKVADRAVYGYTDVKEDYFETVDSWFSKRFGVKLKKESMLTISGIVPAIALAVQAFTKEGDAVIIQTPVYYPFHACVQLNNRKLVKNPLQLKDDGKYYIDFADFEQKIVEHDVKLFILCNPHNPVSRVWSEAELKQVADICKKHNVLIFSDEIHADFNFEPYKHTVLYKLGEEYRDISILATSATKSFNLAGLHNANIFIENEDLRAKFKQILLKTGQSQPSLFGVAATKAAYKYGAEWMDELKLYLKGNVDLVREYLKDMPKIKLIEPEGTYLIWVDFRELGLDKEARDEFIEEKAKLWLNVGSIFGEDGTGFERFNLACPRATVKEAMERLKKAYKEKGF